MSSNSTQDNMAQLSMHRDKIQKMARENEFLNAATQESEITATMFYYNFIILLVVALFLIILLIKFSLTVNGQRGGGSNSDRNYNGYLFLLSIMILFLLIPYFKYSF